MILQRDMLGEESLHLPTNGLPYQTQEIVKTYAKALDCPTEFVVGAAMAAAGQAAGDRFSWSDGIHTNYPQYYSILVGSSTEGKSHAISKMFAPLEEADTISLAKRQEAITGKSKEEKARTPYITNILKDCTTEAHLSSLVYNSGGVTLIHDEAPTFFTFNRYNKGNDGKIYTSLFANNAPYNIARKGDGIITIPHPIVRVIGGIQPEVLSRNFANSEMIDDGMFARFLWFCKPDDFRKDESGVRIDTAYVGSLWRQLMWFIMERKQPVKVMFDANSTTLYNGFKNETVKGYNNKSLFGYELSVCGKLHIYAIMWSMTVAILRYAEQADTADVIYVREAEMSYTLRCMEYFRATAMKVYDTITAGNVPKKRDCILGLKDYIVNQSQFAESIGVSQSYVNQVLGGKK